MNRIEDKFSSLQSRTEKALIAYLTAGDPSLEVTEQLCLALPSAGVDILEVGVPFSDPTADGPIIQAAALRALRNGVTLERVLAMVRRIRKATEEVPIVLFGYYNPFFCYGPSRFAAQAADAGVDGVLIVDLPPEEAGELKEETDSRGIDYINLIAPTTDDGRIKAISSFAAGFLYYISVTGITGTKRPEVKDVMRDIARIRRVSGLPIAVGFGISTPNQAAELAPLADGVVVGSAFVKLIAESRRPQDAVREAGRFATAMKEAMRG